MSVFTSIEIFLFAAFIMAFLQLMPGIFAIFYHSLIGKFSRARAEHTALFFILGAEVSLTFAILIIYTLLNTSTIFLTFFETPLFAWLIAGLLITLGLLFIFIYFRPGKGTELFISRQFQAKYLAKITSAKTRSDAFFLGFTSLIPELIFSAPLLVLAAFSIMELGASCFPRAWLTILFIFIVISPLLILFVAFSHKVNLADFIKFRFKNKPFIRFFIPFLYFLIALLIIIGVSI